MILDRARIAAALPDYALGEVIGHGPHGVVLAAEHRATGAARVVKVLRTAGSGSFLREARALAAPAHPHIAAAVEYAEAAGLRLVVTDFLPGGSLTDRGAPRPRDPGRCGLRARLRRVLGRTRHL